MQIGEDASRDSCGLEENIKCQITKDEEEIVVADISLYDEDSVLKKKTLEEKSYIFEDVSEMNESDIKLLDTESKGQVMNEIYDPQYSPDKGDIIIMEDRKDGNILEEIKEVEELGTTRVEEKEMKEMITDNIMNLLVGELSNDLFRRKGEGNLGMGMGGSFPLPNSEVSLFKLGTKAGEHMGTAQSAATTGAATTGTTTLIADKSKLPPDESLTTAGGPKVEYEVSPVIEETSSQEDSMQMQSPQQLFLQSIAQTKHRGIPTDLDYINSYLDVVFAEIIRTLYIYIIIIIIIENMDYYSKAIYQPISVSPLERLNQMENGDIDGTNLYPALPVNHPANILSIELYLLIENKLEVPYIHLYIYIYILGGEITFPT